MRQLVEVAEVQIHGALLIGPHDPVQQSDSALSVDDVNLLTSGKLQEHLADIDRQANERLSLLMRHMAEAQCVTEALKSTDQMAWVGAMNNIKACAEEIVRQEIVYA